MINNDSYRPSMSSSLGSGMKSVYGQKGRGYFVIEHKSNTRLHRAGDVQKIIIDSVEIGRDPKCQIRFDDSCFSVDTRHAAIVRDNDGWNIVPITNYIPTFVNGRQLQGSTRLQNGDEIQIGPDGPVMGFIEKSNVSDMGMTMRMSLFAQQALKPYKWAIAGLLLLLLLLVGAGAWLFIKQSKHIAGNETLISNLINENDSIREATTGQIDSLRFATEELRTQVDESASHPRYVTVRPGSISKNSAAKIEDNLYYIFPTSLEVTLPTGETQTFTAFGDDDIPMWSGTGFMLDGGVFVTARHIIEPWAYPGTRVMAILNSIEHNGGRVRVTYLAQPAQGKELVFNSKQFNINRHYDSVSYDEDGDQIIVGDYKHDYAYVSLGGHRGLQYNSSAAGNLNPGTELTFMGFPDVASSRLVPVYTKGSVGQTGNVGGLILVDGTPVEAPFQGGPVLYTDAQGNVSVVGVAIGMLNSSRGYIMPISRLFN